MDDEALCYLTLDQLAGQLRERKVTSEEATRRVLERIRKANPQLRAHLTVMEESALR